MGKVAFITGASRGIGRALALRLAREGWSVALAAKSVTDSPQLPGTIYSVADEVAALGVEALPIQCNVIEQDEMDRAVDATLEKFSRVDAVINNAGALWWRAMDETPMKRFDLVMNVNVRAAFALASGFLPAMKEQGSGHVINMSPPIDMSVVGGHIAYMVSKFGMTMMVFGMADELAGSGISATALWPKTIIESYATINFKLGDPTVWRKADILADATYEILQHPEETNGKALIDEDFLRSVGYTDFGRYNCVEGGQPMELSTSAMRSAKS
jgi:citronellol/citronellal dehydrogenase